MSGRERLERVVNDLELIIDAIRSKATFKGNQHLINDGYPAHYIGEIEEYTEVLSYRVDYLQESIQERVEAGE